MQLHVMLKYVVSFPSHTQGVLCNSKSILSVFIGEVVALPLSLQIAQSELVWHPLSYSLSLKELVI